MGGAYKFCWSLTGSPVCGDNVIDMSGAYQYSGVTGSPVCGPKVTNMAGAYAYCHNLTGSPVCGNNVTDMASTYAGCINLTGSPVCGDNVIEMSFAYSKCTKLTGPAICGPNVTNMNRTYYNCPNLSSNGYFYSDKVTDVFSCFYGKDNSKRLNLYVPENSTTLNTCLSTSDWASLVGATMIWKNDMSTNGYYYNTDYNIYIYPVANVEQAYKDNEK